MVAVESSPLSWIKLRPLRIEAGPRTDLITYSTSCTGTRNLTCRDFARAISPKTAIAARVWLPDQMRLRILVPRNHVKQKIRGISKSAPVRCTTGIRAAHHGRPTGASSDRTFSRKVQSFIDLQSNQAGLFSPRRCQGRFPTRRPWSFQIRQNLSQCGLG